MRPSDEQAWMTAAVIGSGLGSAAAVFRIRSSISVSIASLSAAFVMSSVGNLIFILSAEGGSVG